MATDPHVAVQHQMAWGEDVRAAIDNGAYDTALDLLISTGQTPPADLLSAASAKATDKVFPRYIVHYEAYRGRVRVWFVRPDANVQAFEVMNTDK